MKEWPLKLNEIAGICELTNEDIMAVIPKTGKFYRTRHGLRVRIYAVDGGGIFTVHGAYLSNNEMWEICQWTHDGKFLNGRTNDLDLVEAWPSRATPESEI